MVSWSLGVILSPQVKLTDAPILAVTSSGEYTKLGTPDAAGVRHQSQNYEAGEQNKLCEFDQPVNTRAIRKA